MLAYPRQLRTPARTKTRCWQHDPGRRERREAACRHGLSRRQTAVCGWSCEVEGAGESQEDLRCNRDRPLSTAIHHPPKTSAITCKHEVDQGKPQAIGGAMARGATSASTWLLAVHSYA